MKKLNNFYSENDVIKGRQISYLSYCFFGYFLLAATDFLLSNDKLDLFFLSVNTVIFIFFTITVCNLQNVYISTQQLDAFQIDHLESTSTALEETENIEAMEHEMGISVIIKSIQNWETRVDKPFLKETILLSDVANELGVTEMQLSFILNHSLKLNFNTWINKLRIEESKRKMKDESELAISEIAFLCGFSDPALFENVFKKIEGVSTARS